jgi:2-(3-amino-3-carboxypropyl)histidine synthase
MKTLFISCKSRERLNKSSFLSNSKTLPKNIAVLYSIQYESIAGEIRDFLKKTHTITKFSQVLGCSRVSFSKETKAILLVGSGKFHALSLALNSNLPIYIYEGGKLNKLQEKDIESFKKRKKAVYIKFLSSDKIGIFVSTKPGQQNLRQALRLKNKLQGKKSYILIGNNLNPLEFENFPDIQSWINTACPRLDMDSSSIINIGDLNK